jgi:hypothetical protein
MNLRIIYPNESGGIVCLIPTGELSIDDVLKKDVPAGRPYKIIDLNSLPPEAAYWDEFFDALEHDFENDFDGIGGQ